MWDFSTEPEFQEKLDWMARFVREECEPLDLLFPHGGDPYDVHNKASRAILKPLQAQVREQGLWACHLGPELGGHGFGQMKLALMNEILGRSYWAPTVFGTAAPDTGNAEILAMFGTPEQKQRYLQPLLDGEIVSCFSMTEPQGGADPKEFACTAIRDGDEWVIEGEKWFSSNARYAAFLIVMAVTDLDAAPHRRMSMLVVPAETPGIEILRNVGTINERDDFDEGIHGYIRYNRVRVPLDAMLGAPGEGFKVAQARLGGGRVHHAMRVVGKCQRAFDMLCERALSRHTQGKVLAEHQFVQGFVADSAIQLQQFRLLVLQTAWIIDTQPHGAARTHIAMCKVALAQVQHDIIQRALHLHGSLGTTHETPLGAWWAGVPQLALADGPTEVHKATVAKQVLKGYRPAPGLFPTEHLPTRRAAARERYADVLQEFGL
ncbi:MULTISPECIES: acyl-CoA dehydrogenase family protein [unclassified Parafrankia]|uniref:acyl-CoA dehydrogenase family protein n=1 Tax=unclassified Parafrankia TaxID=2994368 RepID=UPI000DA47C08|nr:MULTISPECIES: acyl-CoA dehydrogenase family protein [unclassified Parafrankia]TCJ40035.1 acyl-CoA dehydrogenase [Parafrankia sp. BMG5.11]SQD95996.1 Acyl-CoA dehydrogenase domain protein [Parafrankia sp. Ea1.12]